MKPICYDGYCGLGGWSEGFIAEGWDVTGFDIERHEYGDQKYPGKLILRDMLTVHGSELKDASCLVMSPPCQAYSYMSMPWSRAKQIAEALRIGETNADFFPVGYSGPRTTKDLNALFSACFRIQREACEAAGRYIPMVVENVKGAQPWVGPAKAHYGSFYLWGDVDMVGDRVIAGGLKFGESVHVRKSLKGFGGTWFHNAELGTTNPNRNRTTEPPDGRKVPGMNFHDFEKTGNPGRSFQSAAVDGLKRPGQSISAGFNNWPKDENGDYILPDGTTVGGGTKVSGDWFGSYAEQKAAGTISPGRLHGKRSQARKAASAQIAKIPLPLSSYIARSYRPVAL